MKKKERKQMAGIFRRSMTTYSFAKLALDDAGFSSVSHDEFEYLSELADKSTGKHLGKCYIEGDDNCVYFVSRDDSANYDEGSRVSFEFAPKEKGKRIWAKSIKKLN